MREYQVALTYAGEQRSLVSAVARELVDALGPGQVFYDQYYEAELARLNLDTYLLDIYHNYSRLIVAFLGTDYERKKWCGLEWRAVRDLILSKRGEQIMLVRLDDTEIPGIFGIDGFVDARGGRKAREIAALILQRLESISPAASVPGVDPLPKSRTPLLRRGLRLWWLWLTLLALAGLLVLYWLPKRNPHILLLVPAWGVIGHLSAVTDPPPKPGDLVCSLRVHLGNKLIKIPDLRRRPICLGASPGQLRLAMKGVTDSHWIREAERSSRGLLNNEQSRALQALSREEPDCWETERLRGGERVEVELVRTQKGKEEVDRLGPYTVDEKPGLQWIFLVRRGRPDPHSERP